MAEEQSEQQEQRFNRMQAQNAPGLTEAKEKPDLKKISEEEEIEYRYCKYCTEPVGAKDKFCKSCGEEYGGKENECPYDQRKTTFKKCPQCGNIIVPNVCPKCNTSTILEVCPCGEVLDKKLKMKLQAAAQVQKAALQQLAPLRKIPPEEVQKLEASFKIEEEKSEYKNLQRLFIERKTLRAQRAYDERMKERIIKTFGDSPFNIKIANPEEQAARMKLYAALERSILKKQRLATQAELEELYPELAYIHEMENKAAEEKAAAEEKVLKRRAELAKREKEMEEKYNEILNEIDKEINEAQEGARKAEEEKKELERSRLLAQKAEEEAVLEREREEAEAKERAAAQERARIYAAQKAEAERKAAEEARKRAADKAAAEQRQREMIEMQERKERERYQNRFLGTYYWEGAGQQLTLIVVNKNLCRQKSKHANINESFYRELRLTVSGSNFEMEEIANPSGQSVSKYFVGEVNNSGTAITGNWFNDNGDVNETLTYIKTSY